MKYKSSIILAIVAFASFQGHATASSILLTAESFDVLGGSATL